MRNAKPNEQTQRLRWTLATIALLILFLLLVTTVLLGRARLYYRYSWEECAHWVLAGCPSEEPEGYREELFDQVKIGMTRTEVRRLFAIDEWERLSDIIDRADAPSGIGDPITVFWISEGGDDWAFAFGYRDKARTVNPRPWHYREIEFDSDGRVTEITRLFSQLH